jgi:hypothetical protein
MHLAPRLVARLLVVTAAVLVLAGCLNTTPETGNQYQAADGRDVDAGDLAIRNVTVRVDSTGEGQLLGAVWNESTVADRLVSVTIGDAQATLAGDPALPPRASTILGPEGTVQVTVPTVAVIAGRLVSVTMAFAGAPQVELQALVTDDPGESS